MNAKRYLLFILLFIASLLIALSFLNRDTEMEEEPITINGITVPPPPALNPAQIALGESVYAANCARCHRANLEGQPNWKQAQPDGKLLAPPHDGTGHTWHHPDELLLSTIENGGDPSYSTMPPFAETLSENEIQAVLTFIKSSWGQDERAFQWWVTMKDQ